MNDPQMSDLQMNYYSYEYIIICFAFVNISFGNKKTATGFNGLMAVTYYLFVYLTGNNS